MTKVMQSQYAGFGQIAGTAELEPPPEDPRVDYLSPDQAAKLFIDDQSFAEAVADDFPAYRYFTAKPGVMGGTVFFSRKTSYYSRAEVARWIAAVKHRAAWLK